MSRRHSRTGDKRGQRGAVIVEAALVMPVLLTLILGIMEFGFIWKDSLAISNGTRSAVRVGAADGRDQYADWDIIQQLKSGTTALPSGAIQQVIVWKANSSSTPPTTCKNIGSGGSGFPNYCNVYSGTDVQTLTQSSFANSCFAGPDHYWCPSGRADTQSGPPDYVGVYIKINHNYVTKILGTSKTMTDVAIMRIEPTAN